MRSCLWKFASDRPGLVSIISIAPATPPLDEPVFGWPSPCNQKPTRLSTTSNFFFFTQRHIFFPFPSITPLIPKPSSIPHIFYSTAGLINPVDLLPVIPFSCI